MSKASSKIMLEVKGPKAIIPQPILGEAGSKQTWSGFLKKMKVKIPKERHLVIATNIGGKLALTDKIGNFLKLYKKARSVYKVSLTFSKGERVTRNPERRTVVPRYETRSVRQQGEAAKQEIAERISGMSDDKLIRAQEDLFELIRTGEYIPLFKQFPAVFEFATRTLDF